MTITEAPPSSSGGKAGEWAARAVHNVTLPSGMKVQVRFPDLAILIEGDALPERLRMVAMEVWAGGSPQIVNEKLGEDGQPGKPELNVEIVKDLAALRRHLAAMCLVDPPMTAEDLLTSGVPAEDIDMLGQIAMRERDTDALGVTLGVVPLSRFETFREVHGCGPDCESCETLQGRLSTRRPVSV